MENNLTFFSVGWLIFPLVCAQPFLFKKLGYLQLKERLNAYM